MTEQVESIEAKVARAVAGDARALESVIRAIKDDVYGLAIRMLWHPADAEDATQEILTRVFTRLGQFEGRAAFRTWVYRVAVRGLLNFKRGRAEPETLSFDAFGADLLDGLVRDAPESMSPEAKLLELEVKIGCTQAMLFCLDRNHRVAYLLGEIIGLSSDEAAECLQVPAATYRKRLSRGRTRIREFMRSTCGLANHEATCRCAGRVAAAVKSGRVDPRQLLFADHPVSNVSRTDAQAVLNTIQSVSHEAAILRSNPAYQAPESVYAALLPVVG